MTYFSY